MKMETEPEKQERSKLPVQALIKAALTARENAYAPYSHFTVGAALLCTDGTVYSGCNIENAAYGPGNCAERTAVFKAVSEGNRSFCAIAVAGGKEGLPPASYAWPCGVCRQVLAEFTDSAAFLIITAISETRYETITLAELLPKAFGSKNLS